MVLKLSLHSLKFCRVLFHIIKSIFKFHLSSIFGKLYYISNTKNPDIYQSNNNIYVFRKLGVLAACPMQVEP